MVPININQISNEKSALKLIAEAAREKKIDLNGSRLIRTSSRACLGVEHGDYNGTDLFGFATDRYIWGAYNPTKDGSVRLYSVNFQEEGIVDFNLKENLDPNTFKETWARFPVAVVKVLKEHGYELDKGAQGVILGNIPGGGMSRSASLTINLILTLLKSNGYDETDPMDIVNMAVEAEHSFGSMCGNLDQIMIMFGKEGMGTHYNPKTGQIKYIRFGGDPDSWRFVVMDTGTERPGLDKARYVIRKKECEELVKSINGSGNYGRIEKLADIKDSNIFGRIMADGAFNKLQLMRLNYIFNAQERFYTMLDAWEKGDINTVGDVFNKDGIELHSLYDISGPELEDMCSIARNVPGVLGARMLGGGDKGAAGAIIVKDAVPNLKAAIDAQFPVKYGGLKNKYAVHVVKNTQGVTVYDAGRMDKYF